MLVKDNIESILSPSAIRVLKGLWTTARYSLSEVDFTYKPLITRINYDENGDVDVSNIPGEFNIIDCVKKCRKYLDDSICLMLYFPMTMAIEEVGKNESKVTACLILSKMGILDVFMCSKKGCEFVKFIVDGLVNNADVEFEDVIASYSSVEEPVRSPFDLDQGYFVLEDKSGFFVQNDSTGEPTTLSSINDVLSGKEEDFQATDNQEVKEMFSKVSDNYDDDDFDFDVSDLSEELSEDSSDESSSDNEEDSDDLGEYI